MTTPSPAPVARVQPPPSSDATTVAIAKPAPAPVPPCPPRGPYFGVQRSPCGRWTAHVADPDQRDGAPLVIGLFPDEHAAALAHDRLAIAFHGGAGRLNFRTAFYAIEHEFLRRCGIQRRVVDICGVVADGTYEARYARFLKTVFELESYGEFWDTILQFYIERAAEIGEEALLAGGEMLADKFVAMHRNRAVNPSWRAWYYQVVVAHAQRLAEQQQKQKQLQFAEEEKKASDNSGVVSSTVLSDA